MSRGRVRGPWKDGTGKGAAGPRALGEERGVGSGKTLVQSTSLSGPRFPVPGVVAGEEFAPPGAHCYLLEHSRIPGDFQPRREEPVARGAGADHPDEAEPHTVSVPPLERAPSHFSGPIRTSQVPPLDSQPEAIRNLTSPFRYVKA